MLTEETTKMSNETDPNGKDKMIFDCNKDDILNHPGWQQDQDDDDIVIGEMEDINDDYDEEDDEDDDYDMDEEDAEVVIEHPFESDSCQKGALLDFNDDDENELSEECPVEIENISLSNILPEGSRRTRRA